MILSSTAWINASYRWTPLGITRFQYPLTIPDLTRYLLVLFGGGASHQGTFDEPGDPTIKTWTPNGMAAVELEVIAAPDVAYDSGPSTMIFGCPNPANGSGTLEITWQGRPQVWGSVVAVCLSDINTGTGNPAGVHAVTSDALILADTLSHTLESPPDQCTMISVFAGRSEAGHEDNFDVSLPGGQVNLIGSFPGYTFVRVGATAITGAGTLTKTCTFNLSDDAYCSMSSVILSPGFSGHQIFIIG